MARSVIITGEIIRVIRNQEVKIPFLIDGESGNYSQWGHNNKTLGANVDLLDKLRDAVQDAE